MRLSLIACLGPVVAMLATVLLLPTLGLAVDCHWTHGTGDWYEPSYWSGGQVPDSSDSAYIDNDGTAQILRPMAEADNLYLGYSAGQSGTLELSGILSSDHQYVGYSGTGRLLQTGGVNMLDSGYTLYLGYNSPATGQYEMHGGTLSAQQLIIGYRGSGEFLLHEGAQVFADKTYVQYFSYDGTGRLSVLGGELTTEHLRVYADGELTFRDGTILVDGGDFDYHADTLMLQGAEADDLPILRLVNEAEADVDGSVYIGGDETAAGHAGTLEIQSGAEFAVDGLLKLWPSGAIRLDGGTLKVGMGNYENAGGTFDWTSGTFELTDGPLAVGPAGLFGSHIEMLPEKTLKIEEQTTIEPGASVTVNGGGFSTGSLVNSGTLDLVSGTFALTNSDLNVDSGGLFGDELTIGSGLRIAVESYGRSLRVGDSGVGNVTVSSGATLYARKARLGHQAGAVGTVAVDGPGAVFETDTLYVGYRGSGTVAVSNGGSVTPSVGYLGYYGGAEGAMTIEGPEAAYLGRSTLYIGYSGTGTVDVSDGATVSAPSAQLGRNEGTEGTVTLSGADSSWDNSGSLWVGYCGTGRFTQTAGTVAVDGALYLGYESGSSGTYELSGEGQLATPAEYVGRHGAALLRQSGGLNATDYLSIGNQGAYDLSGGTLEVTSGLKLQGDLNLNGQSWTLDWETFVLDFSGGTILQAEEATLRLGSNALVIIPDGFEMPVLKEFYHDGLTHTAGETLVVPAGSGFGGRGEIDDHVQCAGTIIANPSGSIHLNNGLELSTSGAVDLGHGALTVTDNVSGISGGDLSAGYLSVGGPEPAVFVQTAGNAHVGSLNVGCEEDSGTYELHGGELWAGDELIGSLGGTGTFIQTAGTNSANHLELGPRGRYELSGGALWAPQQDVGSVDPFAGEANVDPAVFVHSGGTNTIIGELRIGGIARSSGLPCRGTYRLSNNGSLRAERIVIGENGYLGIAEGRFEWLGGTIAPANWWPTMEIGADGVLAMGFDFRVRELVQGTLLSGGTIQGLEQGTLEIINGARATTDGQTDLNARILRVDGEYVHNGGATRASYLHVGQQGRYEFTGGSLDVYGGLRLQGSLDLAHSSTAVNLGPNILLDLAGGNVLNAENAALTVGPDSLIVYAEGAHPADLFGSFQTYGMIHQAGTALEIPNGRQIGGIGEIRDYVTCAGRIFAPYDGALDLRNGLSVEPGGMVNLGAGELYVEDNLSGVRGGELQAWAIHVGQTGTGTFSLSSGRLNVGELDVGHGGTGTLCIEPAFGYPDLSTEIWRLRFGEGGTYRTVLGRTFWVERLELDGTLELRAPPPYPGVPPWYGDQWHTILSAGEMLGTFASEPAIGEDLGFGLFFQETVYDQHEVRVRLFQAADGDTDGDRQIGGGDIENILAANKFGKSEEELRAEETWPAVWREGDFSGDGLVGGTDIQAILATNLFGAGTYAGMLPEVGDGGDVVLRVSEDGLYLDTGHVALNGYVLTSRAGVFTGDPADNLGLFREDTDHQITGNFAFTLAGRHCLGDVIGDEFAEVNLSDDLTFTYTVAGQAGIHYATLVVPEPGTAAMLMAGLLGLLVIRRNRKRRD